MKKLFALFTFIAFTQITRAQAVISFTYTPSNGCAPLLIDFTNTSTNMPAGAKFNWYWGDGYSNYNIFDTAHTYTYSNNFYVELDGYDSLNNWLGYSYVYIFVDNGHNGYFNVSANNACPNEVISFNPNGNNFNMWDFGDGNTSYNASENHSYADTGNYLVKCFVNTACGMDTIFKTLAINNSAVPDAGFYFYPNPVCPNTNVNFGPNIYTGQHQWYADGTNFSSTQYSNTQFTVLGNHQIIHSLTNICGNTNNDTAYVSVVDSLIPDAGFWFSNPACPNSDVTFYPNNNSGSHQWSFGDGYNSSDIYGTHRYNFLGSYSVIHNITNGCNLSSADTNIINIVDTITCINFTADTNGGCSPFSVVFTNTSTSLPPGATFYWYFGDGYNDTSSNTSHTFTYASNFYVQLNVYDSNGIYIGQHTEIISVLNGTNGTFYMSTTNTCPGDAVSFDPQGNNFYLWDFGDGNTSLSPNVSHIFSTAAIYYVKMIAITSCGYDTITRTIDINTGTSPDASFTMYPNPVCPGSYVYFNPNTGSGTHQWKRNGTVFSNDAYPYSQFITLGNYEIIHRITNSCNNSSYDTMTVNVVDTLMPDAGFWLSNNNICPAANITFYPNDYSGNHNWNFGDATSSTSNNPTHSYPAAGSYFAIHSITNSCNKTSYDTVIVNIIDTIACISFSMNPNSGCTPLGVTFTNTSSGLPSGATFEWGFGDGYNAYTPDALHTYTSSGNFSPVLYAYDSLGSYLGGFQLSLSVQYGTTGDFYISQTTACPNTYLNFQPAGNNPIKWIFGDGSFGTDSLYSKNHKYLTAGTYYAALVCSTLCGNDTITKQVVISDTLMPNANFNVNVFSCKNVSVSPADYVGSHSWNFGDGFTSTAINPNHAYASTGTYIITHSLSNTCGNNANYTDTISVADTLPCISFSIVADTGCAPFTVNFTNSSSNLPSGTTYLWTFGDGSNNDTAQNPIHVYQWQGMFPCTLNVYDSYGGYLGSYYMSIRVFEGLESGGPGGQGLYISKHNACPNEQITFSTTCSFTDKTLDFGDGTILTIVNCSTITHSYTASDTFYVKLKALTACGYDSIIDTIRVSSLMTPNAGFSISGVPACPNTSVGFFPVDNTGTHSWSISDGFSSSLTGFIHSFADTGHYQVIHSITNFCGNTSTDTMIASIVDTLKPYNNGFYFSPSGPMCPGKQIQFQVNGYYPNLTYSWNFGDGFSSVGQNPKHTYSAAGIFTVTFSVTNECNQSTPSTQTVTIVDNINPNNGFSHPATLCPGELSQFSPYEYDGKTYLYDFGDGESSTLKYPYHAYINPGNYLVTYTVTNFCGNSATDTATIKVVTSKPVTGSFYGYAYPPTVCPGEQVQFYTNAWGYPTFIWNFDDGNVDTNSNSYFMHSYDSAGNYIPTLTIKNFCGNDTVIAFNLSNPPSYDTIKVKDNMPVMYASMNHYPPQVCPGQNLNFNGPWGYPSYLWDMGDGTTPFVTNQPYLNYSYQDSGKYFISMTVSNYCGNDSTVVDSVVVNPAMVISGSLYAYAYPNPACPGSLVNMQGPSGDFSSYQWNFGDSSVILTTSSYQASHSFAAVGTYTVALTLTNFCGDDTTISFTVQISGNLPIYDWLWLYSYPEVVCPGQPANFQLSSGTTYSSYTWNFGDSTVAEGSSFTNHSYSSTGNYNVELTVKNECGSAATVTTSVTVDSTGGFPSWMGLYFSPNPKACPGEVVTLETQGGYSNYFWTFGDGDTITTNGNKTTHVYSVAGKYYAKVKITNQCGQFIEVVAVVDIDDAATIQWIDFYTTATSYCPGDEVLFNIYGNSYQNLTYYWNFGDGTGDTTYGTGTSHIYDSTGVYSVSLVASNACGDVKNIMKSVTINNNANPSLNIWQWGAFSQTNVIGCPGDAVVFYFEGVNGNNLFDFGDGVTATATEIFTRDNGSVVTIIKHAFDTSGTFTVTLTLTNNCGNGVSSSKNFTVSSNLLVEANLVIEPPTGSDGYTTCSSIQMVATGGTDYVFDYGDGEIDTSISPTVSHSYSSTGNYTVNVTITNGCGNRQVISKTIVIAGNGNLTLGTGVINAPSCPGSTDAAIDVTVTGGVAPYAYLWNDANAQSGSTATGLGSGTYTVTVTDDLGCAGSSSVSVTGAGAMTLTSNTTPATCGVSDGTASVTVSGVSGSYSYEWSNGDTTQAIDSLSVGTYSVTVNDIGNGCSAAISLAVSASGGASVSASVTDIACNGSASGAIDITVTGGTAPYTYSWSNNATTEDISGIAAGNFAVTVSDAVGCNGSANFTVAQPNLLTVSFTTVSTDCGKSEGSATANPSGGTGPYTYLWDNNTDNGNGNQTTQTATGLPAAAFDITVTDSKGCTVVGTAIINNNNAPVITATVNNVTCNGLATGSIVQTVTGGTSPYTYTWSNGSATKNISNLVAGNYLVIIRDASSCLTIKNYTVTQPDLLTVAVTAANSTCNNSDGSVTATPTGGNTSYNYNWQSGQSTSAISGVTAGSYYVTVTDNKGCSAMGSATVSVSAATQSICVVTVDDVTKKNLVVWEKTAGQSTKGYNIYKEVSLNVYDSIGYVPYDSLSNFTDIASDPKTKSERYKVATRDSCNNKSALSTAHKTMHLTANLGIIPPPYTERNLVWENYEGFTFGKYRIWRGTAINNLALIDSVVSTTTTYSDYDTLTPGDTLFYIVEVVSPYVCTSTLKIKTYNSSKSNTASLEAPSAPLVASATGTDVTCNGGNDGTAMVTVSGGSPTYNYLWTPSNQITQTATGLTAAAYTVRVIDANSDTSYANVIITEPAAITIGTSVTDATCGNSNGSITATATGGTGGFNYVWSSGQSASLATGLIANSYSVTATDGSGCTQIANATVNDAGVPSLTATSVDVNCFGDNTGSIDITTAGGTGPYTYAWSDGPATEDRSNIASGSYTVTVTDANSCTGTQTETVVQPASALSASETHSDLTCNGNNTGSIDITTGGGTFPYFYTWNDGANTEDRISIASGSYSVTVSDNNSCTVVQAVSVTEPAAISLSATTVSSSCGNADGSATATAGGGAGGFNYAWSSGATDASATGLVAGTYNVTATDVTGCTMSVNATVTSNNIPVTVTATATDATCNGMSDGTATASPTSGNSPYTYLWDASSGNQNTQTATGLGAGNYSVTVTDAGGCFGTQSAAVAEPAAISISVTTVNSSCGNADGSATAAAGGGTGGFNYAWSSGSTDATATGLAAGNYTVTATDANSCLQTAIASVSDAGAPTLSVSSTDITCFGANDGIATVTATGGISPFTYQWSSGSTQSSATGLLAGTETITVTDNAGCKATQSATITEPAVLSLTALIANANSPGNNDGSVDITVNGGTGAYTYTWNNGEITEDIYNLPADTYAVTVTDANGCQLVVDTFKVKLLVGGYYHSLLTTHQLLVYPNPFKHQTTVEYTLQTAAVVTLEIYNVLGERAALLFEGNQPAGKYNFTLIGDFVGSSDGIYIAKLKVDESIRIMPVIQLK